MGRDIHDRQKAKVFFRSRLFADAALLCVCDIASPAKFDAAVRDDKVPIMRRLAAAHFYSNITPKLKTR